MTRSVTIVNTSNWDGEDYIVRTRFRHPGGDALNDHPWEEKTLTPGESMTFSPEAREHEFRSTNSKDPEPFYLNDEQVFPVVLSFVGTPPQEKS